MKQFEYKQIVRCELLTTDILNMDYGQKGWELITIIQSKYNSYCYVFKREINYDKYSEANS